MDMKRSLQTLKRSRAFLFSAALIFLLSFAWIWYAQAQTDTYTKLLIHGDGTDGSVNIFDSSGSRQTITVGNNAQVDTAQSKFGGASMLFDGTDDYVLANGSSDFTFGTGDFTIDFWFRATSVTGSRTLIDFRNAGGNQVLPNIYLNGTSLRYFVSNADRITGATVVAVDTWYHVALARSSGSTKLFLNGTQEGSTYTDSNDYVAPTTNRPSLGLNSDLSTTDFSGHIDEVRVSKGIARWTANFTPPTSAYDSAGFPQYTNIDAAVSASVSWGAGRRVVFTSNSTGYVFYRDSDSICKYSKTTDGGQTWGSAVTVDSQTDCFQISVWYDRWTPGDTSGTSIHILTADTGSDDLWYTGLDTSSDTLTTTVTTTGANQGGAIAESANFPSVTKGTDGTLYMAMNDNSDSYVVECSATCTTAGNWTETGTNPMDTVDGDIPVLVPLSGGDILLVNFDDSADDVRSKLWNNSSWSGAWTAVDASATNNTTYDSNISATVNSAGTTVYLAYLADVATIDGNDDDLRTATYSGGSWSGTTAVETDTTDGLKAVSIGLINSDVYVAYGAADGTTNAKLCTKVSHNSMSTWRFAGCYTGPAPGNPTTWDMKDLSLEAINSNSAIGAIWFDDTGDDQIFYLIPAFNSSNTLTFTRDVAVSGGLVVLGGVSKGSGTFVIDHPLDPKNKLLYHSFVESPDVKNIYDGIAELNGKGEATIELPGYFLALNKDFRYLATAMKEPMPELHLKKEVKRKWWIFGKPIFKLTGGAPNGRVSWQITGIRKDRLIEDNPVEVEVEKGQGQLVGQGECIHEELCN